MKITVVVPVEVDIPDEIVRKAIDRVIENFGQPTDWNISLEDVANNADALGVRFPSGWKLHPDIGDSYLSKMEINPNRKHWGDFVV